MATIDASSIHAIELFGMVGQVVRIEIGSGPHGPLAELSVTLSRCGQDAFTGSLSETRFVDDDDSPGWSEEASVLFTAEDVKSIDQDEGSTALIRL